MLPRLVNHRSRATLLFDAGSLDVERSSDGRFSSDPMRLLAEWESFRDWAATGRAEDAPIDESVLGPCVPAPSQVFAIGLNYRDHAAEAGLELPKTPMVFTKFPSCLVGPRADVILFSDRIDWEAPCRWRVGVGGPRSRGRLLRGPGHLRPRSAVQRSAAAILPRQVARELRADRSCAGPRRDRRRPQPARHVL